MARRRGLSAEDKALWSRVAATAVPMHPARKKSAPVVADTAKPSLTAKPAPRETLPLAGLSMGGKLSVGSTRIDLSPAPRETRIYAGLWGIAVVFGVLFPLTGLTILAMILLDQAVIRTVPPLRRLFS